MQEVPALRLLDAKVMRVAEISWKNIAIDLLETNNCLAAMHATWM